MMELQETPGAIIEFKVPRSWRQSGMVEVTVYAKARQKVNVDFTVIRGGSRDITFYILGPTGLIVGGHPLGPRYYNYGSIPFNASASGIYTLVFDNKFSTFTDKHIILKIAGGGPWSLVEGALEQDKEAQRKPRQHLRELDEAEKLHMRRCGELDEAMNRLMKRHMVVDSLDELYSYIALYAGSNLSKEEYEYCKGFLTKRALKGMLRYDDERLR